jgi:hypothetical protein
MLRIGLHQGQIQIFPFICSPISKCNSTIGIARSSITHSTMRISIVTQYFIAVSCVGAGSGVYISFPIVL